MDTSGAIWGIDDISCNSWESVGDFAIVSASNYSGDRCAFELFRTPDGGSGVINFESTIYTSNWWEHFDMKSIENQLSADAEKILFDWELLIQQILKWLPKGQWRRGPAVDKDLEYALTAYLNEKLNFFGGHKTNEVLARKV